MGARDIRFDALRGLALLMIFIDHVGGNPLARFTLGAFGFADAAEAFVFIAGASAYHAYSKRWRREGFLSTVKAVASRVWTLYAVHMLLFGLVGVMAFTAARAFTDPTYLEFFSFEVLLYDPLGASARAFTLGFLPNMLDVLPLYVVLLSALPVILALQRLHAAVPLGLAVVLYALTQAYPLNLPNYGAASGWFFNPAAWGLLFVCGLTVARWSEAPTRVPGLRLITVCSAAYVLFAAVVAAPWRAIPGLEDAVLVPAQMMQAPSKTYLAPLRLADALAKAWLIAALVPAAGRLASSRVSRSFAILGRRIRCPRVRRRDPALGRRDDRDARVRRAGHRGPR